MATQNQDMSKSLYPFKQVIGMDHILSVLKSRLPISANVYNMAILKEDSGKENTLFYTFQPKKETKNVDSIWIVATYRRYDMGNRYSISVPRIMEITDEVKEAFTNSSVINWSESYSFVSLERRISPLIIEISAYHFGQNIDIIPTRIYTCDPARVMEQDTEIMWDNSKMELKLKGLLPGEGARFLSQNWKYSTAGTYEDIEKLIVEKESVGLYLNGQLVSGVIINDSGVIGLLHTLKEYRGKGYARLVMMDLMKKIGSKGAFPCSCAEIKNYPSIAFHEKLGMKFSFLADYITHATPRYG